MTKRTRDVFTLIEPPNIWSESSDQTTAVATDSEGSYSCSEQVCSPGARAIAANWAVTTTEAVEGPLPGKEAGHVASAIPARWPGMKR